MTVRSRWRAAHVSCKATVRPGRLAPYLAHVAQTCPVMTTTETRSRAAKRLRVELERLRVDRVVRHRREYVVAADPARVTLGRTELLRLTHEHRYASWRDTRVMTVEAVDVATGLLGLILAVHLPSGVQDRRWYQTKRSQARQVRTHQVALDAIQHLREAWLRDHPDGWVHVGTDTNVDQHRRVWRDRLRPTLGASVWDASRPGADVGTHGDRIIDSIHASGTATADGGQILDLPSRPKRDDHLCVSGRVTIQTTSNQEIS